MSPITIIVILSMFAANGFFVAAEFALVAARRGRLAEMADEGKRGAKAALYLYDNMSTSLAACQLGITLASIAIGAVGEHAASEAFEHSLHPIVPLAVLVPLSVALGYLSITAVHITAAEQVPKMGALSHAEKVSCWVAPTLKIFMTALKPFIALLNKVTHLMLRMLRIEAKDEHGAGSTLADVAQIIAEGRGGSMADNEADMLAGVLDLHSRTAQDVMTMAPDVTFAEDSDTAERALQRCVDAGHSRLPMVDEDDAVIGLVSLFDMAGMVVAGNGSQPARSSMREVPIIPAGKPLDDLLASLQEAHVSLAVIADEYGHTLGVVSVEDIVEEIVGEIADETDEAELILVPAPQGGYWVDGQTALTDLHDEGVDLPMEEGSASSTLAGLVMDAAGELPKSGDVVRLGHWDVTVTEIDRSRIAKVLLRDRRSADLVKHS